MNHLLLKGRNLFPIDLSTVWDNADGCVEKYRFNTLLHLLLMLAHAYNIIIISGVGAEVFGR